MEPKPSPRLHSSVVSARLNPTETALLHLQTKRYYSLNETGTFIWSCLEEGNALEEIVEALERNFEVERNEARVVLGEFLDELTKEGLAEA